MPLVQLLMSLSSVTMELSPIIQNGKIYVYQLQESIVLDEDDVWVRSFSCIVYLKAIFGVLEREIHGSLDALFNLA